jgi:serine/threonine protein phosphatase PrpC
MSKSSKRKAKAKAKQTAAPVPAKRDGSGMNEAGNGTPAGPAVCGDTKITVRVFGRTDVGLVREHNEDNFLIADLTAGNRSIRPEVRTHNVGDLGTLFVVCDGMGGAAAGEVASRIGVDTVYEMMQQGGAPSDAGQLARWLEEAIREAGTRIYTAARLNRGQRGMGTTVTAAVLAGPRLVLGQVGDSRAHIIRNGRLVQVTKDQSLVQQLIDAKQLTEEEARNFDRSNIILQALGTTEEVHVDITSVMLRRGDALVMCSDGLSGPVEAGEILRIVQEQDDPMEACRLLTEKACEGGGDDNITVIVARFDGEGLEPAGEGDELAYEKYDFPRITETTVRTPMPKPSKEEEARSKAAGGVGQPGAAGAPAAAAVQEPAPAPAATVAAKPEARAAAAVERATPAAADAKAKGGGGRLGAVLGVLAALVIGGGVVAYLGGAFDGDAGPADAPMATGVPAAMASEPPEPAPAALPEPPKPPPPVPALEAPPLAPVAEEDIAKAPEPPATGPEPQASKAAPAEPKVEKAPEPKVEKAPEPKVEKAKEPEATKTPAPEAAEEAPVKKAAKPKSGSSKSGSEAIPDNPF